VRYFPLQKLANFYKQTDKTKMPGQGLDKVIEKFDQREGSLECSDIDSQEKYKGYMQETVVRRKFHLTFKLYVNHGRESLNQSTEEI
jgi:hypothetical protein